jgi:hypothetical protein
MAAASPITESDILERVVSSSRGPTSVQAARSLLELQFPSEDIKKVRTLLRKNNAGIITAPERLTLENYLRVGQLLDLLHAKAKLFLAKRTGTK